MTAVIPHLWVLVALVVAVAGSFAFVAYIDWNVGQKTPEKKGAEVTLAAIHNPYVLAGIIILIVVVIAGYLVAEFALKNGEG